MANQATLTLQSLSERLETFAALEGGLDGRQLHACVENHRADPALLRDQQLARLYHIDAMPTIFINGVRSLGFHSAEELQWVIQLAVLETNRSHGAAQ